MKEEIKKLSSYVPEERVETVMERFKLKHLVRLSANENPYGTSPKVKEAVVNWKFDSNFYPDSYAEELRKQVAKAYNVPEDQLIFGVGLDEILELLSRTFLEKGDEVITAKPTFSEYALHAQIEEATVKAISVNPQTGHFDFEAALAAITAKTKLIWICNPNNPTGVLESVEDIENFVKRVPETTLVLIDESYILFATGVDDPSCFSILNKYNNLAVLRTFSKVYGLANFRVGFIAMSKQLADYMQTVRLPYNLSSISQIAAQAAFSDQDFVKATVTKNSVEREKWLDYLDERNIKHFESQGNFCYFTVKNAESLAQKLLQNGYQIRTGLQPDWLRVTIGKASDNETMRKVMDEFLQGN
ncbi:MAG: histidinol-phosphate transaminase [Limosilactobacillus sp.]|nr:histidinol-phosphate transaminase [Limosilactobacillus sp.]